MQEDNYDPGAVHTDISQEESAPDWDEVVDETKKRFHDKPSEDIEPTEQKPSFLQNLMSWVIPILIAVLLALILKNYVIINARVPSGSMIATIEEGDMLIGFRMSYLTKDPQRGDIVIFYYPDDESQKFIKRIIGLPGETGIIQDAKIYIDGSSEPLNEDYLPEEWTVNTGPYKFEVPEDSYLMLGDNRNYSADARLWRNTYVKREKIIARAIFIYYPFHDFKLLTDRPDYNF